MFHVTNESLNASLLLKFKSEMLLFALILLYLTETAAKQKAFKHYNIN